MFFLSAELASPAAIVIEDLGAAGLGEVLFDHREDAVDEARRLGRGCDAGGASVGLLAVLGLLGLVRRRR